ncbi:hypothetical protein [Neisseria dentiae]|uniref:hypothetical protein n=1 Tax=Neisseria dentiae TaxID=194197 RepID=UPI000A19AAFC|nr:hypothetical protein [Neisseria dentiae]QMT44366.1 hypothetical protein H3L92_07725 [Neisseria dentiae]
MSTDPSLEPLFLDGLSFCKHIFWYFGKVIHDSFNKMGAYLAMGRKEQDAQIKKGVARSHTQTHTHQEERDKK